MSKKGKIAGIVALVLAIAAAVFAFLEWKQSKAYAKHYAELAESVSTIARTLDSGSGVENQVTFVNNDGKEQGSLSMPVTKGAPGATSAAVKPLVDLADDVIQQRDSIIDTIIDGVVKPLECPANKFPDVEALYNVKEYEGQFDGFVSYVNARVRRDNAVKNQINQVLGLVNARGRYSAAVTETGDFSDADKKAFAEASKNLGTLRANYDVSIRIARELANTLRTAQVSGVQWDSPKAAGSLPSNNNAFTQEIKDEVSNQFFTDLKKLKTQLGRIDQLESEKADLQDELADAKEEIESWKARYQQDEKILETMFEQFVPHTKFDVAALESADQVNKNLTGEVMSIESAYGYVIIDLTQAEVVEGLRLSIFRNGKFIAQVRVQRAMPSNSLTIVEKGNIRDIRKGDSVIVSSDVLQD